MSTARRVCGCFAAGALFGVLIAGFGFLVAVEILDGEFGDGF